MTPHPPNPHTDGRLDGAGRGRLSPRQLGVLISLARDAYAATMDTFPPAESFDDWRHRQCMLVVERQGFRACRNEDYLSLRAHFLRLAGRDAEAAEAEIRAASEDHRHARYAYDRAVSAAARAFAAARAVGKDAPEDADAYARGWLANRHGVTLATATDQQLHSAAYLLRRKAGLVAKHWSRA